MVASEIGLVLVVTVAKTVLIPAGVASQVIHVGRGKLAGKLICTLSSTLGHVC